MGRLALLGGEPVRSRPFPAWPEAGEPEEQALLAVLRSGHWGRTTGRVNDRFERRFAAYQHAAFAVTCTNGTVALELALRAAGIGPGDEVVMPSYTFVATAGAALHVGAVPVFADIDPATYTLSARSAAEALSPRTRAIVPVHLAGGPADLDGITALARGFGLTVIEDAAQATGAEWRGRRVGAIGDLGVVSFQSTKVLTAGEGGAVLTNRRSFAEAVWSLQNVGRVPGGEWYEHHRLGWNLRMTEFQAALLTAQMDRLDAQIQRRNINAHHLDGLLRTIDGVNPLVPAGAITRHSRYLYVFKYRAPAFGGLPKSRFIAALVAEGIPAMPGYPPLHRMPAVTEAITAHGAAARTAGAKHLPHTQSAWQEGIWLPHQVLLGSEADLADIRAAILKIAAQCRVLL